MSKLLIVGTVAFDAIETPFGKTDKILGGAATYIGLSAANFKLSSAIVSVIGEDFPESDIQLLKDKNIDVSGIETVKGGKTFFWRGRYHNDMNSRDTLETQLNVLENFSPVVPEAYKKAKVVMLGNLHPLVQLSVLEQMEKRPKLVVLDTMNFWMDIALDIKKGEHGAFLFDKEDVFFAPALPLEEVFDPTGAGDTFAGGFTGYLASTEDYSFQNMKKAIIHGSNLASFCVEKFGTERMENLDKKEINKRLKQFKDLTQFEIELA